jgi:hypothetical protein
LLVRTNPWKLAIAIACFAIGGQAFAGCGGPPGEGICNFKCACEGCSIAARNSCLDKADSDADYASRVGCYDFYNDFVTCESATGICLNGKDWRISCAPEESRWHKCSGH